MDTIKIRQEHPELIKRLNETMRAIRLWTENNYEDDDSLRTMCYTSTVINNPKSKGRFLSKFLIQCLNDDIENLQRIVEEEEGEKEAEIKKKDL